MCLALVLGSTRSPNGTVVQVEVMARRIGVEDLQRAMAKSDELTACLLRYVHCFGVQVAHSARANALGYIEARVARWLLLARDRLEDNDLPLTHDYLAKVLGVRRAGVADTLNELQHEGLLLCKRGQITIVNPDRTRAGSLYGVSEVEFDRLFSKASRIAVHCFAAGPLSNAVAPVDDLVFCILSSELAPPWRSHSLAIPVWRAPWSFASRHGNENEGNLSGSSEDWSYCSAGRGNQTGVWWF